MSDDDLSKKASQQIFSEKRVATKPRRGQGSRMRGPERRLVDRAPKDVERMESYLGSVPKTPITQELARPPRPSGYFTGGGQGMRYGVLQRNPEPAMGYLAKKAGEAAATSSPVLGDRAFRGTVRGLIDSDRPRFTTGLKAAGKYMSEHSQVMIPEAKAGLKGLAKRIFKPAAVALAVGGLASEAKAAVSEASSTIGTMHDQAFKGEKSILPVKPKVK